jgi:ferredoxin
MRVVVDHGSCQGHGRCYDLAPEVFGADDEGYVVLLVEGELAAELEAPAQTAVRNCPERALSLEG